MVENASYVDIKDVMVEYSSLFPDVHSYTEFVVSNEIKKYVYGQVDKEGMLAVTKRYTKKGSIYIDKVEVNAFVQRATESLVGSMAVFPILLPANITPPLPANIAPPLLHNVTHTFTNERGQHFTVVVRGKRTKDEVFFKLAGVMKALDMHDLCKAVRVDNTLKLREHYVAFNVPRSKFPLLKKTDHYLTYQGVRRVLEMESCRIGTARSFRKWVDEIVSENVTGSQIDAVELPKEVHSEQVHQAKKTKAPNADAERLRVIMSKSATQISCLYLINVGISDEARRVFKYGFTDNIQRRFKQHMKHYGDQIVLDTFALIPMLDLSKAEAELKNSVSRFKYIKEGEDELISLCEEGYHNIKTILRTISNLYCGNMQHQIFHYDGLLKDLKHSYELTHKDKDLEIMEMRGQVELAKKENEMYRSQIEAMKQYD